MSFVVRLLFIWGFLLLIDPGTQVCVTTASHWFLVVEISPHGGLLTTGCLEVLKAEAHVLEMNFS